MNKIEVTIGYHVNNILDQSDTFSKVYTKYVGSQTDNGVCYKDLDAWKRGGYDDVIYISEGNDEMIADDNFIEMLAYDADWQDLSTLLATIAIGL